MDRDGDAVIVRSPIAQANFLFRAAGGFHQIEAPEGFAVMLEAKSAGGATATIRLRLGPLSPGQARRGLDAFVQERQSEYLQGYKGKLAVSGEENRRVATVRGKAGVRFFGFRRL